DPAGKLDDVPVVKVEGDLSGIADEVIRDGAVVIAASAPDTPRERAGNLRRAAAAKGAKIIVIVDRDGRAAGLGRGELIDPEDPGPPRRGGTPLIRLHGKEIAAWFDALPSGATGWQLALDPGEQVDEPVKICNVAALLHGSDPALSRTHVIV